MPNVDVGIGDHSIGWAIIQHHSFFFKGLLFTLRMCKWSTLIFIVSDFNNYLFFWTFISILCYLSLECPKDKNYAVLYLTYRGLESYLFYICDVLTFLSSTKKKIPIYQNNVNRIFCDVGSVPYIHLPNWQPLLISVHWAFEMLLSAVKGKYLKFG